MWQRGSAKHVTGKILHEELRKEKEDWEETQVADVGEGGTEVDHRRAGTLIRGHPGHLPAAGQTPLAVFLTPKVL